MSLRSDIEAALPELRAAAESLMLDDFTAYSFEWTTVDGIEEEAWVERDVTRGKVPNKRMGGDATNAHTVTVGGVERVVIEGGVHLPWADSPQVGWHYVLTWPGPSTHPSMLGKRYQVVETHPTSAMTAWRLDVVEVPA